ncbi:MAG TPA: DUF362 domain-containing protein [Polyangiaceae bacterium]|nr:DUF362 domain-containing protein [Polyangiaceae bacterium]
MATTSTAPATATTSAPTVATEAGSVDVTSQASTTWTSGPSVVTSGSVVDAAALRERHRARIAADRGPVHLLRGGTPLELGRRACEAAVPSRPPSTKVLIKPNLGGFEWFKDPARSGGDDGLRGRITDPEFVRGIIRCLRARGHTAITVAEGWGAKHADWERLVRVSGYAAMASEERVPLVAMDDDGTFDVEGDMPGKPLRLRGMERTHVPTLLIPKALAEHLDAGLFISAPKLKTHRFGVFSAGIKGMQGTVMLSDRTPAFSQKWRMHRELGAALALGKRADVPPAESRAAYVAALETFAERIADVLEVEAPHVVLVEGAPFMGGDGFGHQYPGPEALAVAGTNPVLVDRVVAEVLGLWDSDALARELGGHRTSPLLEIAAKRLGVSLDKPRVVGDGASLLEKRRPAHLLGMAGFAIHEGAGGEVAPGSRPSPAAPLGTADAGGAGGLADAGGEVRASRLRGAPPELDGQVDAVWATATPVTWDTDWSGRPTGVRTTVRFLWSDQALYGLWELEGAGLNTDTSRPVDHERERLYQEDCVELFLTPDPAHPRRYFEIELGPFGHVFDIDVDREAKREDIAWSSGAKVGTRRDAAGRKATVEVALSAPQLVAALGPGKRLPLGLFRMEGRREAGRDRLYLAFRPTRTPKPNFHVPEAFGRLFLAP